VYGGAAAPGMAIAGRDGSDDGGAAVEGEWGVGPVATGITATRSALLRAPTGEQAAAAKGKASVANTKPLEAMPAAAAIGALVVAAGLATMQRGGAFICRAAAGAVVAGGADARFQRRHTVTFGTREGARGGRHGANRGLSPEPPPTTEESSTLSPTLRPHGGRARGGGGQHRWRPVGGRWRRCSRRHAGRRVRRPPHRAALIGSSAATVASPGGGEKTNAGDTNAACLRCSGCRDALEPPRLPGQRAASGGGCGATAAAAKTAGGGGRDGGGGGGGGTAVEGRWVVGAPKHVGRCVAISWASSIVRVVVWSACVLPLFSFFPHVGD